MAESVEDISKFSNMIKFETEDLPENEIFQSPTHAEENKGAKTVMDTELRADDTIKGENEIEEYKIEYLEDFSEEDVDFLEENDSQDYSDHDKMSPHKKTGKKKKQKEIKAPQLNKKSKNIVSHIDELRKEHPMLAKNEQALVEHLASVMRGIKPPEPPEGYCKQIVHDEQAKYECTYCGVKRDTAPLAARHYQFSHGELYLTCFACGVKYRNTTNLYKHEMRCSAPDAKIVLQARGRYLGRKGRGRPYTTSDRFITANTLALQRVNNRLYCSQCPASFAHRHNLAAHENSHRGLRPFRCQLCGLAYTSSPALKRHQMLHGEYRYVCDHCGRKFQLKPALISHLDSHRPLRKHPCRYCERRFAQKIALNHHMNKVHLKLPAAHGCPICPKRYARLTHVKEHAERTHGLTLITRRMYFQALPAMTDSEVILAKKYFHADFSSLPKDSKDTPDCVLPDLNSFTSQHEGPRQHEYVQIIKKEKIGEHLGLITTQGIKEYESETESLNIKSETEEEIEEVDTSAVKEHENETESSKERSETEEEMEEVDPMVKEEQSKYLKPKLKKSIHQRETIKPEAEIVEYIDNNAYNIQYKQTKKTALTSPGIKKAYDEMQKIACDIRSTITEQDIELINKSTLQRNIILESKPMMKNNQPYKIEYKKKHKTTLISPDTKKAFEEMKLKARDIKSTSNYNRRKEHITPSKNKFYEIRGEEIKQEQFVHHFGIQIKHPEIKKEVTDIIGPNTEIQDNNVLENIKINELEKEDDNNDAAGNKALKENEHSEKNKVIADFFEYLKSGVVPKRVHLLRRGGWTKDK